MLKKITLSNTAPFTGIPAEIIPARVNFIFGHNGSGKSTLGRYLSSADDEKYKDCKLEWENDAPLPIFLYTSGYVSKNFQEGQLKGIFSLGKKNNDIKNQLETKRNEKIETQNKKNLNLEKITQCQTDLKHNKSKFIDSLWNIRSEESTQNLIDRVLPGNKGSKNTFLRNFETHYPEIKDRNIRALNILGKRANVVFSNDSQIISEIDVPDIKKIQKLELEASSLLREEIVGADNTLISNWIKQLGAESWFKEGLNLLPKSDGKCPFCEKECSPDLEENLKDYFNEAYNKKLKEIEVLQSSYNEEMHKWDIFSDTLTEKQDFFDTKDDALTTYNLFYSKMKANLQTIKEKQNNPPLTFILEQDTSDTREAFIKILESANQKIRQHNQDIKDKNHSQEEVRKDLWRYIASQVENDHENYSNKKLELETKQKQLEKEEKEEKDLENSLNQFKSEIEDLEKQSKNVTEVASDINRHLKICGFTSFSLKVENKSTDIPTYSIVRNEEDTENTFESLSEGEKSFISFLYFYNEIIKLEEKKDCIVIFDDPVTSMDSETLFATNALIRTMCGLKLTSLGTNQNKNIPSHVKQIFILTHNIYFHHRISYTGCETKEQKKDREKNWRFFNFMKHKDHSTIISYAHKNPIKSTSENWWEMLRKAKKNT